MRNARQILVKNGAHIGTQRKIKSMNKFIFKTRDDGLAVLNVQNTIDRLKAAARLIAKYPAEDVLVVAGKEQAQKPAEEFAQAIGATRFIGRFLPGTMTNPDFEYFIEPKVIIACDPFGDKQSIDESIAIGIPVICLASTNNTVENVDLVIPCNNKGRRSLASVYWLLANYVLFERGELKEDEEIVQDLETYVGEEPKEEAEETEA
jgi:small subunit ribosomal protein S2